MGKDRVCLGVITGSFGVKGEARVKSFCAEPSAIADYGALTDEDGRSYAITITRPVKGGFAVRLSGIRTKEEADAAKGKKLFAARTALPDLPEDEYYYSDLIGLLAIDTGGVEIGKIAAIHDHGAGDLLEVSRFGGKGSVLVPFNSEIVPTVDIGLARVILDPPEGLLEDAKGDSDDG